MNARVQRWLSANPALFLALFVGMIVFPPGCKSAGDERRKPGGAATQPSTVRPASTQTVKSPKELALADFLKTMKLEGQPVLIEFGLVGCELSEKGIDSMIALQKAQAVPGVAFVRVEGNQDASVVEQYFKAKAPPFPVYRDTHSAIATALGATAFPTFLLADKFGHVRYTGKYPQEHLVQWSKALVDEAQDPGSQVALFGARKIDVDKLLGGKLPDLDGTPRTLSWYMGTGGMMVLFVDTACPFSAMALKDMPMVSKSLADRKINAIVVNNDDNREKVLGFYAKNAPGVPVLYDVGAATREQWNVQSVPIAVYLSPAGKVGYQGEAIWSNMGSAIETSLGLAPGTIKFTAAGTGFG